MRNNVFIKNMVCPRCIQTVEEIMKTLRIDVLHINLGEVEIGTPLTKIQLDELGVELKKSGFELLKDQSSKIINKIKSILIASIHYTSEDQKVNYSTLLSDKLQQEYSSLSKLFSSVEGITIEKFVVKQNIERVKKLIIYDER